MPQNLVEKVILLPCGQVYCRIRLYRLCYVNNKYHHVSYCNHCKESAPLPDGRAVKALKAPKTMPPVILRPNPPSTSIYLASNRPTS